MSGASCRWIDPCAIALAGLLLAFAGADVARADLGSSSVVGSWQCTAVNPDPTLPEGSQSYLVSFDLGRTVLTTNPFNATFRGAGTWQRSGVRRFASREVVNGVDLLAESEYRLDRDGTLSFDRVLSPLDPSAPFPPFRLAGTCRQLPGGEGRPASLAPRLIGSWQCSAGDPADGILDVFPAFTFSLGQTAKSSFGGPTQGQGTWEQSGPRTFRSQQQVIAPPGLIASLDASLLLPPTGPLQLEAELAVDVGGESQRLALVGTCTRVELDPLPPSAGNPLGDAVVGSWRCRSDVVDDLAFSVTFELGQTFLASPGLTGHGVWRRSGRSSFASRDALAVAPFGFLLFDSAYELDRRGALAFEREGFVLDPATGRRIPIDSQSGSCERITAGAR